MNAPSRPSNVHHTGQSQRQLILKRSFREADLSRCLGVERIHPRRSSPLISHFLARNPSPGDPGNPKAEEASRLTQRLVQYKMRFLTREQTTDYKVVCALLQ